MVPDNLGLSSAKSADWTRRRNYPDTEKRGAAPKTLGLTLALATPPFSTLPNRTRPQPGYSCHTSHGDRSTRF